MAGLRLSRREGELVYVTFPDGRKGEVLVQAIFTGRRPYVDIVFDFPKDVKLVRAELLEKDRDQDLDVLEARLPIGKEAA